VAAAVVVVVVVFVVVTVLIFISFTVLACPVLGRAVAQSVSRWFPTSEARVRVRAGMWDLWWTKRHWGRFSPSTSVSSVNHHPTNFSIIIITRRWHSRPICGRGAEWTQLDSTPPHTTYTNCPLFVMNLCHNNSTQYLYMV
jgi:hypothetical protein